MSRPTMPHPRSTADNGYLDLEVLKQQETIDWQALKRHFLLSDDITYLNTGTLGACPDHVLKAAWDAWVAVEQNPADCGFGTAEPTMEGVREKAASFVGCDKQELAIIENTTVGMHLVAQGLHLRQGDRILTTNHEHVGGLLCWKYYAKYAGVEIDTVDLPVLPRDKEDVLDRFESCLKPGTRAISVSHVTYSGLRLPIRELATMAREKDVLLVVDGAQAPGMVPVDVKELGCHTYANSSHKWTLAPKGTGLLYLSAETADRIRPLPLMHGPAAYTASTGTRSAASIAGLGAAIDFHRAIGVQQVFERLFVLREKLYQQLREVNSIRVVSPPTGDMASALLVFELPDEIDSGEFRLRLRDKHRLIVRSITRELVNGIRISTHLYNDEEDIGHLLEALRIELE